MQPSFSEPFPILSVRDLPQTVAFYQDCFGFAVGYQWPPDAPVEEVEFIVLQLGEHAVGFGKETSVSERVTWSGIQLCIRVDDVHQAWDWLMQRQATSVESPMRQPWDEWSAVVADPNGIRVMLYAPMATT